jgi:UDP-N-acetylglucosamine--N-acetylmuramyl-(pentapeptide) pyrophosphoryl-undecaprenol N-acetylglucosamine transferase
MKVVLTGGCTGGHIYPALAIGDKFREKIPDCEVIYLGHDQGLERYIVPKHGYELKFVRSKWVDRSNAAKLLDTFVSNEVGRRQAMKIMKDFKPDVVMSTGSFVSVPVVLAAHRLGINIYIHEQNAYPGMANKFLSRYARKVFLGFGGASKYFDSSKTVYTGNPVRSEFGTKDRKESRRMLGIPEDDFVILTFGGSLGADKMNEVGKAVVKRYGGREHVTVLFGTGKDYYDGVIADLEKQGLASFDNVKITPYISRMADTLAASSIVISRSGALSTAEIMMSSRPAIFIPSPNVTGDHQYYNAKSVVENGGAIIVNEDEESADRVVNALEELIADPALIADMEEGSFRGAPVRATDIIFDTIMEDLGRK